MYTVNSRYLKYSVLYLELFHNLNKTLGPFSINSSGVTTHYFELFFRSPEFEISRVDCSYIYEINNLYTLKSSLIDEITDHGDTKKFF